ncbi:MAG: tetratricopeptide repeat protein [Candidatus ainarchaeum sp.]|nr:tetratricopeptide repeat protein [Candidatus ainarchaeum sp.]
MDNQKMSEATDAYSEGLKHLRYKDPEAALAEFKKAAELNPNSFFAAKSMGEAFIMLGRYEEALPVLRRATDIRARFRSPPDPDVSRLLGECHFGKGMFNEAIEHYTDSLKSNYDYGDLFFKRGLSYYNLERYGEALVDFRMAQKCRRRSDNLVDSELDCYSALCFDKLGNYGAAQAAFKAFMDSNPPDDEKKAIAERLNELELLLDKKPRKPEPQDSKPGFRCTKCIIIPGKNPEKGLIRITYRYMK